MIPETAGQLNVIVVPTHEAFKAIGFGIGVGVGRTTLNALSVSSEAEDALVAPDRNDNVLAVATYHRYEDPGAVFEGIVTEIELLP